MERTNLAKRRRSPSGEVDVVAETRFARPFKQPQQRRSLLSACLSADDDDDAVMRLRLGELQEVVAVAGHQEAVVLACKSEDSRIRGSASRTSRSRRTSWLRQQVREILWYVLVEQEPHR